MLHAFEKLLTEISRSSGSASLRNDGATAPGREYTSRSYTSSATIQMPCFRQCSKTTRWSSGSIVHPVGLPGELITTIRVSGVSAAISRSTSSVQRPFRTVSGTRVTCPPRIFGISAMFGQIGVTITTLSPGRHQHLRRQHQRRHARPGDDEPVRRQRRCREARRRTAPAPRAAPAVRGSACRTCRRRPATCAAASRMNCRRRLVAFAEPERRDIAPPHPGIGDLADARRHQRDDVRPRRGPRGNGLHRTSVEPERVAHEVAAEHAVRLRQRFQRSATGPSLMKGSAP